MKPMLPAAKIVSISMSLEKVIFFLIQFSLMLHLVTNQSFVFQLLY